MDNEWLRGEEVRALRVDFEKREERFQAWTSKPQKSIPQRSDLQPICLNQYAISPRFA